MNHLCAKLFSVAAGVLALFILSATPASTAQGEYYWGFTQDKEYFEQTDRNGRFTAQAPKDWVVTMAWSFQISPAQIRTLTSRLATSGTRQCPATNVTTPITTCGVTAHLS